MRLRRRGLRSVWVCRSLLRWCKPGGMGKWILVSVLSFVLSLSFWITGCVATSVWRSSRAGHWALVVMMTARVASSHVDAFGASLAHRFAAGNRATKGEMQADATKQERRRRSRSRMSLLSSPSYLRVSRVTSLASLPADDDSRQTSGHLVGSSRSGDNSSSIKDTRGGADEGKSRQGKNRE